MAEPEATLSPWARFFQLSSTEISFPEKGAWTESLPTLSDSFCISPFSLSTCFWASVTLSWAAWLKIVYRGWPSVTMSPLLTNTSSTVPLLLRVIAADSLDFALPLPDTLLWMEPIWAGMA